MTILTIDGTVPEDNSDISLGAGAIRDTRVKVNEVISGLEALEADIVNKFSVFYDAVYWDVAASPISVTVPAGCTKMHLLSVRGGFGGGGCGAYVYVLGGNQNGSDGAGGPVISGGVIDVIPGETLSIVLGTGGAAGVSNGSGTGAGQSGTFTKIIRTSDSSELVAVAGGYGGAGYNGSDSAATQPVPPVAVTTVPTIDANKAAAYSQLFSNNASGGSGGTWAMPPGGYAPVVSTPTAGKNGYAYIRFSSLGM